MTLHFTKPFVLTALFALSACGGSGGGDDSGGGGGMGTNGLEYGQIGQTLDDAEGVAVTMQTASFQAGSNPTIGEGVITLDTGFFGGARNGTVKIFGETVTITDGAGELSTLEDVRITYEPNRSGTYAGALDITVSGPDLGDINGEGAYVFGFETNPTAIAARTSGSLIYTGGFQATGALTGSQNTGTEYEGTITVTVGFAGSGTAAVALDGTLDGSTNADLGGTFGLSGNGFSGNLNCTSGCSNVGSSIDATFYGPNADELGGVIDVDITGFDGVGTFILTDPIPN